MNEAMWIEHCHSLDRQYRFKNIFSTGLHLAPQWCAVHFKTAESDVSGLSLSPGIQVKTQVQDAGNFAA